MKLSIIIVAFNSYEMISKCIERLVCDHAFNIVVVDNNSRDGAPSLIRDRFPSVKVIEQEVNIGYGRAANVGLRSIDTPYALLLNPDVIAYPNDVKKLFSHAIADVSNTAIWGPATSSRDFTGQKPSSVHWVSGSAMLFEVEKIKQIGMFDENIFLFSEETDLCERLIENGFQIKHCQDVFFRHLVGQSTLFDSKIEYMKWWHFGWSQCYRMTKNGHNNLFKNPRRKLFSYRIRSFLSTSKVKRLKWGAKADGAMAFLRGEKAFRRDGTPQMLA